YEGAAFEDKHGKVTTPVVNDVEALHRFTNLSNPVDFAGRLVYDEDGDACINFGKHKGRKVVHVFEVEPSYYAWMQQGDLPRHTKKGLDKLSNAHRNKKKEQQQNTRVDVTQNRPHKEQIPAKPITEDMLQQLQWKFGK